MPNGEDDEEILDGVEGLPTEEQPAEEQTPPKKTAYRVPITSETARAYGRKGALAAAETKRRKKEMKEVIEIMLDLNVNENTREALREMGVTDPDDYTVRTAIVVAQGLKAMKGDTKAAQFIFDYGGYDPKFQLEMKKFEFEQQKNAPEEKSEEDVYTHIYMPALDEETMKSEGVKTEGSEGADE